MNRQFVYCRHPVYCIPIKNIVFEQYIEDVYLLKDQTETEINYTVKLCLDLI